MGFRTNKSVYYHIPKTGGIWVKRALRACGLGYWRTKNRALRHRLLLRNEHDIPRRVMDEDKDKLFSYTFVRNPFDWYKSFWAFRKQNENDLKPAFPLDFTWHPVFEKFVENAIKTFPEGFLTDVYQCYVGKRANELDFVGKQENLREDLIKALTLAGEEFDKKAILQAKRKNMAGSLDIYKDSFTISDKLKQRLLETEKWITEVFYK